MLSARLLLFLRVWQYNGRDRSVTNMPSLFIALSCYRPLYEKRNDEKLEKEAKSEEILKKKIEEAKQQNGSSSQYPEFLGYLD